MVARWGSENGMIISVPILRWFVLVNAIKEPIKQLDIEIVIEFGFE